MFSKNNKEIGFSVSTPTVSRHLKHLEEAGYIKHEKEGSQKIIYSVNSDKIMTGVIKKGWNQLNNIARSVQSTRNEFFSSTEHEQLNEVLKVLCIRELYEIKAQVDFLVDKNLENHFTVMVWNHPLLTTSKRWIIGKCVEDTEYRKKVLFEIDKLVKNLW